MCNHSSDVNDQILEQMYMDNLEKYKLNNKNQKSMQCARIDVGSLIFGGGGGGGGGRGAKPARPTSVFKK